MESALSYLVLARKSRPQRFAEVIGQQSVIRTLQNALTQQRVAHAMIFSGVRGTGKTTLARIVAKALNCEHTPANEPCNTCRFCREITEGSSLDVHEIDGASNRGIQEIRELKEKIRFLPAAARFKIIIIDEVHMLTTEAFNALLKTLEEPPSHVYFMFATTELHKVPVTILSRCQRYELKRLQHNELAAHFKQLADREGIQIDEASLAMIAREAGASVRDGLSLLDQLFSYCGTTVTVNDVVTVLGLVRHDLVADLAETLLDGELDKTYTLVNAIYAHGLDIRRLSNDLLQWYRGLILWAISPDPSALLELPEDMLLRQQQAAARFHRTALTAQFNVLMEGLDKVSTHQQPRLAFELALLRAIQVHEIMPVTELITRFDRLLEGEVSLSVPLPDAPPKKNHLEPMSVQPVTAKNIETNAPVAETPSPAKDDNPSPTDDRGRDTVPFPAPPPPDPPPNTGNVSLRETSEIPPTPAPAGKDGKKKIRQQWDLFIKYIAERQRWMAATLQLASSVQREGDILVVHFEDAAVCSVLKTKEHLSVLTEMALDYFQESLSIHFEVPGLTSCELDQGQGLAPQQERKALANDPLVQTALDVFTGQVGDIRIGTRYKQAANPSSRRSADNVKVKKQE